MCILEIHSLGGLLLQLHWGTFMKKWIENTWKHTNIYQTKSIWRTKSCITTRNTCESMLPGSGNLGLHWCIANFQGSMLCTKKWKKSSTIRTKFSSFWISSASSVDVHALHFIPLIGSMVSVCMHMLEIPYVCWTETTKNFLMKTNKAELLCFSSFLHIHSPFYNVLLPTKQGTYIWFQQIWGLPWSC